MNSLTSHKRATVLLRRVLYGSALCGSLIGCSGTDATGYKSIPQDPKLYTALQLNVRAAVMATVAPYDTLQLVPTAYAADGTLLSLPGPVTYMISDTSLSVTSTGLVTAKHTTESGSYIVAQVQDVTHQVTHTDTCFIKVTDDVPDPIASFSIQPVGQDSAILDLGGVTKTLSVTARDINQNVISTSSLATHFSTSNTAIAQIDADGEITSVQTGSVLITASTRYYGVEKMDTLRFIIDYPFITRVTLSQTTRADKSLAVFYTNQNSVVGVHKVVLFGLDRVVALYPPSPFQPIQALFSSVFFPFPRYVDTVGVHIVFDDSSMADSAPSSVNALAGMYAQNGQGNINPAFLNSEIPRDSVYIAQYRKYEYTGFATYCTHLPYLCAAVRSFATPGVYHWHDPITGLSGQVTVLGTPTGE